MAYNRLAVDYEKPLSPSLKLIANNAIGYDVFNFGGGADLYLRSTIFPVMGREGLELELPDLTRRLARAAGLDVRATTAKTLYLPGRTS